MRKHLSTIILGIVLLAGLSLLLYPTISDYWNSYHQSKAIAGYVQAVDNLDDEKRQKMLEAAQEYNEKLFNPSTASWHLALIWLTVRQARNHITEYSRTAVTFIVYYQTFLKRTTVHVARTNGAVSVVIPMRIPAICNTVLNSTAAVASPKPFKDAVPSAIAQSTPLYPNNPASAPRIPISGKRAAPSGKTAPHMA